MQERRVVTAVDAKLLVLRAKMILMNLTPADAWELEMMYQQVTKGRPSEPRTTNGAEEL